MLSTVKRELLTFGYVREQYNIHNVPEEIIILLMQWFDNTYHIIIKEELLQEFLAADKWVKMKQSYDIHIHDYIQLKCAIHPNEDGYARLSFYPQTTLENMDRIAVFIQTRIEEIPTSSFEESHHLEYDSEDDDFYPAFQQIAHLSRCKDKEQLTISIKAELCKYREVGNLKWKYFMSPIWNDIIEYEWIIYEKELAAYKCDEWLLSDHFMGESASFYLVPKGTRHRPDDILFGLQFSKLLGPIVEVSVDLQLKTNFSINNDNVLFTKDKMFYIHEFDSFVVMQSGLTQENIESEMKRLHELRFYVKMTIKHVEVTVDNPTMWYRKRELERTEWEKYGIVTKVD